ncbi:MAG TPA: DUF4293 domain-containing protein [Cytophagales bacterium]|nr:DUF4293 domain-containing protein [Cytophagales bacterium]
MIQRIQSLFLLGIVICMVLFLIYPIWEKADTTKAKERIELDAYSLTKYSEGREQMIQNTLYLAILAVIIAGLSGYELFSFKNRILQRKIGAVNSLLLVTLLAMSYYLVFSGMRLFNPTEDGTFEIGFFLIIISAVLNILANRFIMRDEKLVRSADRMRD